jgi:hypothetical protein
MAAMTRLHPRNRYGVLAATAGSLVLLAGCSSSEGDRAEAGATGDRAAASSRFRCCLRGQRR